MLNFFRTVRIYIKISKNKVEVTDLETGKTVSQSAENDFSSIRNVVSNFNNANQTIGSVLKEMNINTSFWRPRTKILIQQLEVTEGGLSDIEKRALRDLGEMAGGNQVYIIEHSRQVSIVDALLELQKQ